MFRASREWLDRPKWELPSTALRTGASHAWLRRGGRAPARREPNSGPLKPGPPRSSSQGCTNTDTGAHQWNGDRTRPRGRPAQLRALWPDETAGPLPAASAAERSPRRLVAFLGRTSTDDQQDPTLPIPRPLASCRGALPAGSVIVAQIFDIESGRKELAGHGRSSAHERFDTAVSRDGGIAGARAAPQPENLLDGLEPPRLQNVTASKTRPKAWSGHPSPPLSPS